MRLSLTLLVYIICFTAAAQSFYPRDLVISAGEGAGITDYNVSDTAGYTGSDKEGGINFTLRAGYGLSPSLSVDFNFSVTGLITETLLDDNASCYIFDMGPGVSYHVPWKNKWIDLEGGIGFGYTRYLYESYSNQYHERLEGSGVSVFSDFHPRLYFTKRQRLGGFLYYRFNLYFMGAQYVHTGFANQDLDMTGNTHSFGLGLFYRFGKGSADPPKPLE